MEIIQRALQYQLLLKHPQLTKDNLADQEAAALEPQGTQLKVMAEEHLQEPDQDLVAAVPVEQPVPARQGKALVPVVAALDKVVVLQDRL